MLQFFKKSSRKGSRHEISDHNIEALAANTTTTTNLSSFDKNDDSFCSENVNSRIRNELPADDTLSGAEQYCQKYFPSTSADSSANLYDSKLSKDITKIVTNHQLLSYFIQFLENRNALSLIKFWLEAESFKSAASTELNPNSTIIECKNAQPLNDTKTFNKHNKSAIFLDEANSSSGSTVSTVVATTTTSCDLGRSLTDDEKTQLCEQKNSIKNNIKESLPLVNDAQNNQNESEFTVERQCFKSSLSSDAVYIFKKYLTTKSCYHIDIPATILSKISLALVVQDNSADREDHENQTNIPEIDTIFIDAQSFVLDLLKKQHLQSFIESSYYCKYCMDILTGNTLCIQDILHCESVLFFFMEFLEQENHRHYLEFWIAVNNFRGTVNFVADETDDDPNTNKSRTNKTKIYNNSQPQPVVTNTFIKKQRFKQIQSDAVVLYDKYISLEATTPLGLSNLVRLSVEENICTTDPIVIFHCFDLPIRIIERYLEQKYFKSFLTSNLFEKYLTELSYKIDFSINSGGGGGGGDLDAKVDGKCDDIGGGSTIKNDFMKYSKIQQQMSVTTMQKESQITNATIKCHRKTNSDCTNQNTNNFRNISCQNTLLAMDTSNKNKKSGGIATPLSSDMLIDSQQLYNPDLLWRPRRSASIPYGCGLSFGHIDALGRYKRDFEMDSTNVQNSMTTASGSSMINSINGRGGGGGGGGGGISSVDSTSNKITSTGSKIRQVVRKLVNMPEEREQEEIAWQVAEMIVKDITSVTLSKSDEK